MQGLQQHRTVLPGQKALLRPRAAHVAVGRSAVSVTAVQTAYKGDASKAIAVDAESIAKDIRKKSEVTVGAPDASKLTTEETYRAAAWSVREKLFDAFFKTQAYWE